MEKFNVRISFTLIALLGIFFALFSIYSIGNWGGADSYVHYRISKYAFKYPLLFLDLWGKPVFNILSSPFSQLGFIGIKIFNVLVALFSAWLIFDFTRIQKWEIGFMSIPFLLCAPIYFIIIPSGLTEPLFGLIIAFSVWLFYKEEYLLTSVVISFLPFARNEGFVILPIFLLAFVLKKRWSSIPFLATGFLVMSTVGWIVFNDFFWIINFRAGAGSGEIYGSGRLFHFVIHANDILGWPILLFFLIGVFFSFREVIKNRFKSVEQTVFFILIIGSFVVYFSAHSYVWWKGTGGSLGLIRVIAGVIPLAAIIATKGIVDLFRFLNLRKFSFSLLVSISLIVVVLFPFFKFHDQIPIRVGEDEYLIRKACVWLKESHFDDRKIHYFDPLIPHYLEKDPFDQSVVLESISDKEHPDRAVLKGSIVIWDAHFGPNEGRIPINLLLDNSSFTLLQHIVPEYPFKTLNDYNYEIYIFERK